MSTSKLRTLGEHRQHTSSASQTGALVRLQTQSSVPLSCRSCLFALIYPILKILLSHRSVLYTTIASLALLCMMLCNTYDLKNIEDGEGKLKERKDRGRGKSDFRDRGAPSGRGDTAVLGSDDSTPLWREVSWRPRIESSESSTCILITDFL